MRIKINICSLLLVILFILSNCTIYQIKNVPYDFTDRVFEHIKILTDFGERTAEKPSQSKTINYIKKFFIKHGLSESIDPFEVTVTNHKVKKIEINGNSVKPHEIIFSRQMNQEPLIAKAIFLNHYEIYEKIKSEQADLKIVITKYPVNRKNIKNLKTQAVVILKEKDYMYLKKNNQNEILIDYKKFETQEKSFNITGSINSTRKQAKNILLTAHWDSYNSTGANDNASGIGVMLELARLIRLNNFNLPFNFHFIAFGEEEDGLLGSKAYVNKYYHDLKDNCIFLLNIDVVGGHNEKLRIETNINEKRNTYKKTGLVFPYPMTRYDYREKEINTTLKNSSDYISFQTSVPDWLMELLEETSRKTKIQYIKHGAISSDIRSFMAVNVPATSVSIFGGHLHCYSDNIYMINKPSLAKAGRYCLKLLQEVTAFQIKNIKDK